MEKQKPPYVNVPVAIIKMRRKNGKSLTNTQILVLADLLKWVQLYRNKPLRTGGFDANGKPALDTRRNACYPTTKRIIEDVGGTEITVKRAIAILAKEGFISITRTCLGRLNVRFISLETRELQELAGVTEAEAEQTRQLNQAVQTRKEARRAKAEPHPDAPPQSPDVETSSAKAIPIDSERREKDRIFTGVVNYACRLFGEERFATFGTPHQVEAGVVIGKDVLSWEELREDLEGHVDTVLLARNREVG